MNVTEVKRETKTMVLPRTNFKLRIQANIMSYVDNSIRKRVA